MDKNEIIFSAIAWKHSLAEFLYYLLYIVRSIDITCKKEYNYEYEEGRIIRATEADIILSEEIVTSKTVVNTIKYYYVSDGKLIKKRIMPTEGEEYVIYYETPENENTVTKFTAGGRTVI